jgi:hypothetical protein
VRPVSNDRSGANHRPQGPGGTHPGRISTMRNVTTPLVPAGCACRLQSMPVRGLRSMQGQRAHLGEVLGDGETHAARYRALVSPSTAWEKKFGRMTSSWQLAWEMVCVCAPVTEISEPHRA